jgi:hypothetical protein
MKFYFNHIFLCFFAFNFENCLTISNSSSLNETHFELGHSCISDIECMSGVCGYPGVREWSHLICLSPSCDIKQYDLYGTSMYGYDLGCYCEINSNCIDLAVCIDN